MCRVLYGAKSQTKIAYSLELLTWECSILALASLTLKYPSTVTSTDALTNLCQTGFVTAEVVTIIANQLWPSSVPLAPVVSEHKYS